jgi:hypothetical protein
MNKNFRTVEVKISIRGKHPLLNGFCKILRAVAFEQQNQSSNIQL